MKRRKNLVLATIYTVGGIILAVAAIVAIVCMYFSGTFIPVYDENWNIIVSAKVFRYALYAILAVIAGFSMWLANYGSKYLIKRLLQRKMGRC